MPNDDANNGVIQDANLGAKKEKKKDVRKDIKQDAKWG